jgi:large subunit ribosomal protein L9
MAKTEVILTHNIVGLGGESDHVKVAAGYARNFLYPQGLAIPVTAANKRRLEVLRQRRAEREAHELNSMTDLAKGLSKMVLLLKVKTGEDGKMFGSVTAGTIADELKHQFDVPLDKRKIRLDRPLHQLGEHDVELRLHADVNATLKVRIESSTPLPLPAEATTPEGKAREGTKDVARGKTEGEAKTAVRERRERPARRPLREEAAPAE